MGTNEAGTDRPIFVYTIYIETTRERAWEALTSPEFTRQYWRKAKSDWQPGSPVRHYLPDGQLEMAGEVLERDYPRRLVWTFQPQDEASLAEGPSRVTFELSTLGETVRLTVTHDQFPIGSKVFNGIQYGWPAILSNLKTLLEAGRTLPYGAWE